MPPRKSVRTLQDLALAASTEFLLSSCERIEQDTSSSKDLDLPFDSETYKNAVERLQQHIRTFVVSPLLLETLFKSVKRLYSSFRYNLGNGTLDDITLYSVFVFDDVNRCKFQMPDITKNLSTSSPKRFQFWLHYAGMFPNLTELDVTREQTCNEIFVTFCQFCTKLQVVVMHSYPSEEMLGLLVENCKNLREIVVKQVERNAIVVVEYPGQTIKRALEELEHLEQLDFRFGSNVLENLNTDRKLKLKRISLNLENSNHVEMIANLCPDLDELDITSVVSLQITEERSKEILENLASSSLKISKFSLFGFRIDSDALYEFLASKGTFIKELSFAWCGIHGKPRSLLETLSNCQNMTKLTLRKLYGLTAEHLATPHLVHETLFPNIEHLSIDKDLIAITGLSLANKIVENSLKISTLNLTLSNNDVEVDIEEPLGRLFTCPTIKQMTRVDLKLYSGLMVQNYVNLIRNIIESCPIITFLQIPFASEITSNYVDHLRRVHKKENIDFTMN